MNNHLDLHLRHQKFVEMYEKLGSNNFSQLARDMKKPDGTSWDRTYVTRVMSGNKELKSTAMLGELSRVTGYTWSDIRWYFERLGEVSKIKLPVS